MFKRVSGCIKHYFGHSFKPNTLSEAQKLTNMYKDITVIGSEKAEGGEVWSTLAGR